MTDHERAGSPPAPVSLTTPERFAALAATTLLAGLLLMWVVVTPAYRSSDEPMHISTTLRLAESARYPAPGRALMDPSVLASYRWVSYFGATGRAPTLQRPPALAHPPSMRALSAPQVPRPRTDIDQMTQHPPGYYLLLAAVVRLLQLQDASPYGLVLGLRLVSAAMYLPIPYLCLRVAKQVALPPRVAAASAFLPAAWMQFVHSAATVNNSALLALATSAAIALLIPAAQGDVRGRRALAIGAAVSVALLAKGFALALLPVVLVAYLLGARRSGIASAAGGLVIAVLATAPGLWWWVLNVVRYGSLQPKGGNVLAPVADIPPLSQWATEFALTWMRTLWVALGWAESRPPPWLYIGLTALFATLLLVGSWTLRRCFGAVLLLHLLWLGPLAIVVLGSLQEFLSSGQTRAAQGRYLQTAVVALAVLVAASLTRLGRGLPLLPPLVAVLAGGGWGYGLYHFWRPAGGHDAVWGRVVAMSSWWPGGVTWLTVGAGLVAGSGLLGWLTVRAMPARRPDARVPAASCSGASAAARRTRTTPRRRSRHRSR